jgi:hypothetical protein
MIRNLSRRTFLQRLSGVSLAACLGGLLVGQKVEARPKPVARLVNGVDYGCVRGAEDVVWVLDDETLMPDGLSVDEFLAKVIVSRDRPAHTAQLPPAMMVKKGTWY